jgi:VCBS repeat-containing protein
MALIGKVVGMTGVASLILGNGDKRPLNLGDSIQTGDTIQTPRGVEVDLELASGRVIHISAEQLITFTEDLAAVFVPDGLDNAINLATIDTVIKAIEEGRDISEVLEETAAGEGGQFNAYGFGFIDLVRINDDLNNFDFIFDTNAASIPDSAPAVGSVATGIQLAETPAASVIPTSITGTLSASLTETDAIQNTGGSAISSATFVAQTNVAGSNGYGKFTIDASGVWIYTMDSAHNEFIDGVNYTDSIVVANVDGATQTITISITGTNDAPQISTAVQALSLKHNCPSRPRLM